MAHTHRILNNKAASENAPQNGAAQSGVSPCNEFHDRLSMAAGELSYRKLGKATDTHPETVRRYMQGQSPSATFLTNLCYALGISGEWLLTGRGPMKRSDMRTHALKQANPAELLMAIASTVTSLSDQIQNLDQFVQAMQSHSNPSPLSIQAAQPNGRPKAAKLINPLPNGNHVAQRDALGRVRSGAPSRNGISSNGHPSAEPKPEGTHANWVRNELPDRTA